MAVDFAAKRKEAEKQGLISGGDYFKLREGANRFRLMSECLPHNGEYQGKPNFKWLCYVIDRFDGKVKPFFMAHSVYKQIEALQQNPDYEFNDVPMPYDLTINATGAGTKDAKYTVVPARKNTDVTGDEMAAFDEVKPIDELQKALLEKSGGKSKSASHDDERDYVDDSAPF